MAIKRFQFLRGNKNKLVDTPLKTAELFLDKDSHEVVVGDESVQEGNFTLANKTEVTNLKAEVSANTQDIADIMLDYAKIDGGGNTLSPQEMVTSSLQGTLGTYVFDPGKFFTYIQNGGFSSVYLNILFNKRKSLILPLSQNYVNPIEINVQGVTQSSIPFCLLPLFSIKKEEEQKAWNQITSVMSDTGKLLIYLKGPVEISVPFILCWTDDMYLSDNIDPVTLNWVWDRIN